MSILIGAGIVINALEDFDFNMIYNNAKGRCEEVGQAVDLIRQAADQLLAMQDAIPNQWKGDAADAYINRLQRERKKLIDAADTLQTTRGKMLSSLEAVRTQWPKKYSIIPD